MCDVVLRERERESCPVVVEGAEKNRVLEGGGAAEAVMLATTQLVW